jgi:hypothetical protein
MESLTMVVAVEAVAARRQQQWRRLRKWTTIGGKSGRQQEHGRSHDGMQYQKRTADNNATTK